MEVAEYLDHLNLIDRHEASFKQQMLDLSLGEFRALAAVAEAPVIIKDVAGQRAVAAQGTGRVLKRLAERGLVKIERYERDKRAKIATVTEPGMVALARGNGVLTRVLADDSLTDDRRLYSPSRVAQSA